MLVSHKRRNGFFGLSNLLNHTAGRRWVAKATATSRGSRTQIIHSVLGNARKMRSQDSVLALRSFKTYLPPACAAQSFRSISAGKRFGRRSTPAAASAHPRSSLAPNRPPGSAGILRNKRRPTATDVKNDACRSFFGHGAMGRINGKDALGLGSANAIDGPFCEGIGKLCGADRPKGDLQSIWAANRARRIARQRDRRTSRTQRGRDRRVDIAKQKWRSENSLHQATERAWSFMSKHPN